MKYLFKRKGSQNWNLRLQLPNGKSVERSLGTPDVDAAEIAARDAITAHKTLMYERKQARAARIVHGPWQSEYTPGLHTLPDGRTLIATERDLTFSDGTRRPNGGPMIYLTGAALGAADTFRVLDDAWDGKIGEGPVDVDRPKVVPPDADTELLELYIKHANLNPARAKEARDMWHLFKRTVKKPLAKCDRNDGRAVVAALGSDIKSATARRKMVPLVAMANFAISEGKLTFNPFAGCVADREDSERRLPFDDKDMASIRTNLPKLSANDQLLVRTLATTGMRLSEAFEIGVKRGDEPLEQTEGGCRYVIVGTKTDQSLRRVPFPKALLPHLPKKITAPLFAGKPNAASTRLAKWLRDECGITSTAKVAAHSYRHRAKDRLRMKHPRVGRCPDTVAEEIFGRDKKTVSAGYGIGSPVPDLKVWIDLIGF